MGSRLVVSLRVSVSKSVLLHRLIGNVLAKCSVTVGRSGRGFKSYFGLSRPNSLAEEQDRANSKERCTRYH